jgi:hypothetical protein
MPDDRDLQSRFDALRVVDRAGAPEFGAIVGRPARRRRPVALPAALAAAAVLLAFGSIRLAMRGMRPARSTEALSILTWRSPTASLLRTPASDLYRGIPTLRSSVLRDSLILHDPGA